MVVEQSILQAGVNNTGGWVPLFAAPISCRVSTLTIVQATIAMSFLCIFSIYPARRYTYEFFLLLHIALAVLFLISMW